MKISVLGVDDPMRISITYQGTNQQIDSDKNITIKEVLVRAGINSSMVLVCNNSQIIPQTSVINSDIKLEIIDVGSGG
jgi:sulfur carrier protein ThiS